MSQTPKRLNIFFGLVLLSSAAFVLTILISITSLFSDAQTPVFQFIELHGFNLMTCEVLAIVIFGTVAMRFDNSPIVRNQHTQTTQQADGPLDDSPQPDEQIGPHDQPG